MGLLELAAKRILRVVMKKARGSSNCTGPCNQPTVQTGCACCLIYPVNFLVLEFPVRVLGLVYVFFREADCVLCLRVHYC